MARSGADLVASEAGELLFLFRPVHRRRLSLWL